jgi:hypothetical protein
MSPAPQGMHFLREERRRDLKYVIDIIFLLRRTAES